jgi:hypothetical protein
MLSRMTSLTEAWLEQPANGYEVIFPARAIVKSKNRILDLLNIRYLIATRFNESETLMRSSPIDFVKFGRIGIPACLKIMKRSS